MQRGSKFGIQYVKGVLAYDLSGSLPKVVQNKPIPQQDEDEWHKRKFEVEKLEKGWWDVAATMKLGEIETGVFVANNTLNTVGGSNEGEWARAFNALKEWDNKLSLECGMDSVDKMRNLWAELSREQWEQLFARNKAPTRSELEKAVAASKSASASSATKGQGPKTQGKGLMTDGKGPKVQQSKGSVQHSSQFGIDIVKGVMVTYNNSGQVVQDKPIPLKDEEEWHKRYFATLKEEKALFDQAAKKELGERATDEFVAKHTLTAMNNSEDNAFTRAYKLHKEWSNKLSLECGASSVDKLEDLWLLAPKQLEQLLSRSVAPTRAELDKAVAASAASAASSAPKAGGNGAKPQGKGPTTEGKGPKVQQPKGSVQRSSQFGIDIVNGAMVTYDNSGKVVQDKPIPLKDEEEWHKRYFGVLKEEKALYDEAAKMGLGEQDSVGFVAKHTLGASNNSETNAFTNARKFYKAWSDKLSLEELWRLAPKQLEQLLARNKAPTRAELDKAKAASVALAKAEGKVEVTQAAAQAEDEDSESESEEDQQAALNKDRGEMVALLMQRGRFEDAQALIERCKQKLPWGDLDNKLTASLWGKVIFAGQSGGGGGGSDDEEAEAAAPQSSRKRGREPAAAGTPAAQTKGLGKSAAAADDEPKAKRARKETSDRAAP